VKSKSKIKAKPVQQKFIFHPIYGDEGALVVLPDGGVPAVSDEELKEFEKIAKSQAFLPRLQMCSSSSNPVKKRLIPADHYGLFSGGDPVDLGGSVNIIPLAYRAKALLIDGDEVESNYDANSPRYKELEELAGVKDSGAMFGPEFLVYIGGFKKFALLHMNSATSRRNASAILKLKGKGCTLNTETVEKGDYIWTAIKPVECNVMPDVPTNEEVLEAYAKFKAEAEAKPKKEVAPDGSPARDR